MTDGEPIYSCKPNVDRPKQRQGLDCQTREQSKFKPKCVPLWELAMHSL